MVWSQRLPFPISLRLDRLIVLLWRSSRGWCIANVAVLLTQSALPIALLYVIQQIVDTVGQGMTAPEPSNVAGPLLALVAAGAGITLLHNITALVARLVAEGQSQSVTDFMYEMLQAKSLQVDLAYYEQPGHRDALQRLQQQMPYRPSRVVHNVVDLARACLSALSMVVLLASFHWFVVALLLVLSLPEAITRVYASKRAYSWRRKRTPSEQLANYLNQLLTTVATAQEIRLLDLGHVLRNRFISVRETLRRERLRVSVHRALTELSGEAIAIVGMFAAFGFIGHRALLGTITIGAFVMYLQALQRAWGHSGQILKSISALYEDNLFLTDLFEFMNVKPSVVDPVTSVSFPRRLRSGIVIDQLTFAYPGSDGPNLIDVSLTIQPGECVAFVGRNGSGKSTLLKLLCRLYDPTKGRILVDGIDLRRFSIAQLRQHMSVLPQHYAHYQLTARDNIWFGDTSRPPNEERIKTGARRAGIHDVICALKGSYSALLGTEFEGAHELSAGQWQRLAFARFLTRDAPIVVLDEPTSALDREMAEDALEFQLGNIATDKIAIIATHDLTVLRWTDRIYVLDNGRLVASGTHDELTARDETYRVLCGLSASI